MKIINVSEISKYDFSLTLINVLKQPWQSGCFYSCFKQPKQSNLFLYFHNLNAEYESTSGKKFSAKNNDVIYTPLNSEYKVTFSNPTTQGYTLGIKFLIYDQNGEAVILDDDISAFTALGSGFEFLFSELHNIGMQNQPDSIRMKAIFHNILADLIQNIRGGSFGKYNIIANGIIYLQTSCNEQMSMKEIAKMCNVSESYFRKLFKEYSGMTPNAYLLKSKIKKAKSYLRYDNLSIADIANLLGFSDSAYFIKRFREETGITPDKYRKSM